jgi:hypothetical protein
VIIGFNEQRNKSKFKQWNEKKKKKKRWWKQEIDVSEARNLLTQPQAHCWFHPPTYKNLNQPKEGSRMSASPQTPFRGSKGLGNDSPDGTTNDFLTGKTNLSLPK